MKVIRFFLFICLFASISSPIQANADEVLQQRINKLEAELQELKELMRAQIELQKTQEQQISENQERIRETSAETTKYSLLADTTFGGYGEIIYNNYDDDATRDEFDMQRFIIFMGHRFSDRTRMYSEIEFEHAQTKGGTSGGEVALEQAYIAHQITPGVDINAGLMIIPIGMTNEYHEPPVFYGNERNEVEQRIIPTTWRELGLSVRGKTIGGLEYTFGLTTTPDASKYSSTNGASYGFKDMRTVGQKAAANDIGYLAGLNYRGILGLEVGATVWSGNTSQKGKGYTAYSALSTVDATLTIWDAHLKYSNRGLDVKALYAAGTLSDTASINSALGISGNKAAPESFYGYYGEVGYHVYKEGDLDVAPFFRYARYNTQESVASGYTIDPNNNETVYTFGVNFYVHPQVVFKFDIQDFQTADTKDRYNLGVGWMF